MTVELLKHRSRIANQLNIGTNHFVHFSSVDIDVDDFGFLTEFFGVTDNTIIKTRADVQK